MSPLLVLAFSIVFRTTYGCDCPQRYDPYSLFAICCSGTDYSDPCKAKCGGVDVRDCTKGKCGSTSGASATDCVCTMEYDPYCCGAKTFSNSCRAKCGGFEVSDCTEGRCSSKGGGGGWSKPGTGGGSSAPCMCTMQWEPYCCDEKTVSNPCVAKCGGIDISDCTEGKCSSKGGGGGWYGGGGSSTGGGSSAQCKCTKQWDPYCCGEKTFGNRCTAECVGNDITNDCTQGKCKRQRGQKLEMDDAEASQTTTRTTVGASVALLVAVIVALGVCMWCRYKKKNQMQKEMVLDQEEEEEDEDEEEEDLSEVEIVMPTTRDATGETL